MSNLHFLQMFIRFLDCASGIGGSIRTPMLFSKINYESDTILSYFIAGTHCLTLSHYGLLKLYFILKFHLQVFCYYSDLPTLEILAYFVCFLHPLYTCISVCSTMIIVRHNLKILTSKFLLVVVLVRTI